MQNRIVKASSRNDLERFYPVLKELRTELSYEKYIDIYNASHQADGYELLGMENEGEIVAVMGYRILHDYVHGKHLYVDDLVTTRSQTSKGLGALFLKHAEEVARESGCEGLRLCTGIENERGKKFYEREGWTLRAVAFKKKLHQH